MNAIKKTKDPLRKIDQKGKLNRGIHMETNQEKTGS